jgi:hypothetical protein
MNWFKVRIQNQYEFIQVNIRPPIMAWDIAAKKGDSGKIIEEMGGFYSGLPHPTAATVISVAVRLSVSGSMEIRRDTFPTRKYIPQTR